MSDQSCQGSAETKMRKVREMCQRATNGNVNPRQELLKEDERMIGRLPEPAVLINGSALNEGMNRSDQVPPAKKAYEQCRAMQDEWMAGPTGTEGRLVAAFPPQFTREGLLAALRAGLRLDGLAAVSPPDRMRVYEQTTAESTDIYHQDCKVAREDYDGRLKAAGLRKAERDRTAILDLLGL